ncbi:MAG: glycosyltransferase family 2 protein [Actinomycetota bacterium]|nr:glycosyltransferase family 2 protein [Actinomycetota bacterium]
MTWVLSNIPEWVHEVILVDANSDDGTAEVARAIRPDIVVISEPEPRGKGSALRAGFRLATGEVIVMIDADGSMTPGEMIRLLVLLADGFDLVKGSRFMAGGSSADITRLRRIGNKCLLSVANALYGTRFTDLCYGFCAFRRDDLDLLALDADGFEIEAQLVVRAVRRQLKVTEVPSLEGARTHGTSKLRTFSDGTRVLRTVLAEFIRPRPLAVRGSPPAVIDLRVPFSVASDDHSPGLVLVPGGEAVVQPDPLWSASAQCQEPAGDIRDL